MALTVLGGCQLTGKTAPTPDVSPAVLKVETNPTGAILSFPDGTTCETPCTLNITEEMRMEVAKAGYEKVVFTLYDNEPGYLMIDLDLAAPTTGVEESALPDL